MNTLKLTHTHAKFELCVRIVESFNIGSACEWKGRRVGRQQGLGVAGGWLLGGKALFCPTAQKKRPQ